MSGFCLTAGPATLRIRLRSFREGNSLARARSEYSSKSVGFSSRYVRVVRGGHGMLEHAVSATDDGSFAIAGEISMLFKKPGVKSRREHLSKSSIRGRGRDAGGREALD